MSAILRQAKTSTFWWKTSVFEEYSLVSCGMNFCNSFHELSVKFDTFQKLCREITRFFPQIRLVRMYCGLQVVINEARGLPPVLSNFVFCQYTFWTAAPITVPSVIHTPDDNIASVHHRGNGGSRRTTSDVVVRFHHSQASGLTVQQSVTGNDPDHDTRGLFS